MAIKLKKEHFETIDNAFVDILKGERKSEALSSIERVLTSSFGKQFEIKIIKPKRNSSFYIMSVFPEQSTIDKLIVSILDEESDTKLKDIWDDNSRWFIEIDNRILTGDVIDITSKELTALLLHECGHIIYSNSIPQRMSKVMKYEYAKANIGTKNVLKNGVFKKLLEIPILKACIFENYRTDASLKKELKADIFAVKMGYGKELDSVLNKIISTSSLNKDTATHINQDSKDVYERMKSDTLFSINTIENFKKREAKISKATLHKMLMDMPSEYVSNSIGNIEKALFSNKSQISSAEDTITEAAIYFSESAYVKEAFGIFKKDLKRIDPSVVDYVNIRKEGMKSNDDKLMLVSYIHGKLDLIDYYLDIMDNPKYAKRYTFNNSRNELMRMRDSLERSRIEILNYRIPEVRYGVQIMYPDGYTG